MLSLKQTPSSLAHAFKKAIESFMLPSHAFGGTGDSWWPSSRLEASMHADGFISSSSG
jgi:hypothetical protein